MIPALEIVALQKISSLINRSQNLSTVLESALEELVLLLDIQAGFFHLMEAPYEPAAFYRGLSSAVVSQLDQEQDRLERLQESMTQDNSSIVEDLARGDHQGALGEVLRREGFRSLVLYPIRCDERTVGILGLASKKIQARSKKKNSLIQNFSDLLGIAITNAKLQGQENRLSEDLITLQEMNKIISRSFNLDDIIQRIVVEGKRLVKPGQCHLFLLDERLQSLVGSASTESGSVDIRSFKIKLSEASIAVTCLTERRTIAIDDLMRDERGNERLLKNSGWRAALFTPLLSKDQAIGVLICSDTSPDRSFTQQEIFRAETLAHQAAIALENARLFQVVSRSQKEWETTFDAMQDCVSVHDLEGRVFRANVALARRLKATPPKVIGKYCSEIYDPAVPKGSGCRHNSSLRPGALTVEELELPLMGGTFQLSVTPWYDKNNRLVGSIHVAKDISNEKLLQQQLVQSEKLSAIGELIAGIAHELNNPLTGVMGYSQLLQLRKDLDDRAKENLLKINNLALRCQKIVQNLLSFARKQRPERTLADINEILEKTVELRNYELKVNNIEIFWELETALPKTIVDVHQLQQVFLNVITNAEQAMLEANGRGKLMIRTRADRSSNRIQVEISDDGPGISEAHRTKIFDPFFTTKDVGKGTGLGLSLSYGIIQEHGGSISAHSRAGEGATFTIELPILAQLPEELAGATEHVPAAQGFENLIQDKRILVVDDEKYILDFFVEIFDTFPVSVDTASNGRIALEKIQGKPFDLIITDFRMPSMGGRELFAWIKDQKPELVKRVIFVTGDTVSDDTRSFLENNGNRFLAKPFKIEEVKDAIQQTLAEGQAPN